MHDVIYLADRRRAVATPETQYDRLIDVLRQRARTFFPMVDLLDGLDLVEMALGPRAAEAARDSFVLELVR